MNKIRDIALMAMGGAITLAYQKYNKQMAKTLKKQFDKTVKQADAKLDEMM